MLSCDASARAQAAEEPWVDSVHTRINPYRTSMDDSPIKVVPVLQKLKANGKGVVGMKLVGAGKFSKAPDKINHAMDFVLNLGCVDVMVVGFESLAQCEDCCSGEVLKFQGTEIDEEIICQVVGHEDIGIRWNSRKSSIQKGDVELIFVPSFDTTRVQLIF